MAQVKINGMAEVIGRLRAWRLGLRSGAARPVGHRPKPKDRAIDVRREED